MLMLILGVVAVAIIVYYYVVKPLNYWKERGVEYGQPKWIFGHFWGNFIGTKNGADIFHDVYTQSPKARYTGMYRFSTPILLLRDPDLIRQITIKDFEAFTDHFTALPIDHDPLWTKNLLNLNSRKWKDTRSCISPSFTTSKIRGMFKPVTECAENLVQHLLTKNTEVVTIEMKDLSSRYTSDLIATFTIGFKVNSIAHPENEFYKMSHEIADISSLKKFVRLLLYWCIPSIKYLLKIQLIDDKRREYFRGIINHAIKTREENDIKRPDMLHLLLETRKNVQEQKKNGAENIPDLDLNNDDITAHAAIFIMAGIESVSSLICFTIYELTLNPDVQNKLRGEILETLEKCEGELTYESVLKMKYLNMVLSESLRKWPPFIQSDRLCTKSYTIEPVAPGEKQVHLEKNTRVSLPTHSIQHDPKYFPDPERFDPERFSDENKGKIHPYSYFPFGGGPRGCIGFRFALLETKILLFKLLSKFEIVPVDKTQIPLQFSKNTFFNLKPTNDFWCGFKRYNK